jgi:hypothetical protein
MCLKNKPGWSRAEQHSQAGAWERGGANSPTYLSNFLKVWLPAGPPEAKKEQNHEGRFY